MFAGYSDYPMQDYSKANQTGVAPLVAVVILNRNGRRYLEQFLPFLEQTTYRNLKLVVADNGSTDDSVEWIRTHHREVTLLAYPDNTGFAMGYNRALQDVKADYYVLLNSDVQVTPGWIEPVISLMESDRLIAACQPKIRSHVSPEYFEYAGASGGWLDDFGYPFSRGRIFDVLEKDSGQYDDAAPCFWASGAAMFVRASVFHELGGLDTYFFAHQEEIDFCWRTQLAGYKVYVQPASVVYHIGGGTLPKANNRKVFLNFRNNLIMLAKNLPTGEAFLKIPVRMGLDMVAAWKGLLGGSAGYFAAIWKAHYYFLKWLIAEPNQHKHQEVKNRVCSGWYHGSVIWHHFVKRRTKFSEIVGNK